MPYTKNIWKNGDALTITKLNAIEEGIVAGLDVQNYEEKKNKVQKIDSSNQNDTTKYPSAKAVYDLFTNIQSASNFTYPKN